MAAEGGAQAMETDGAVLKETKNVKKDFSEDLKAKIPEATHLAEVWHVSRDRFDFV